MPFDTLVVYEDDLVRIRAVLDRLHSDAAARIVFLVHRNGEQIASVGFADGLDTTSLASLTAGNVAATRALARLLGESEFSVLLHEGTRQHLQIHLIPGGSILVVVFDDRTTLGLVRLRVRKAAADLAPIVAALGTRGGSVDGAASGAFDSFAGITDGDVDALFR